MNIIIIDQQKNTFRFSATSSLLTNFPQFRVENRIRLVLPNINVQKITSFENVNCPQVRIQTKFT